ncbi:Uncharacterised protein [Vibrio cholerae]|nr:Uncharacterised protein [Vibrio cholerae]
MFKVFPVSIISSTSNTSLPLMSSSRSFRMRTSRELCILLP